VGGRWEVKIMVLFLCGVFVFFFILLWVRRKKEGGEWGGGVMQRHFTMAMKL